MLVGMRAVRASLWDAVKKLGQGFGVWGCLKSLRVCWYVGHVDATLHDKTTFKVQPSTSPVFENHSAHGS